MAENSTFRRNLLVVAALHVGFIGVVFFFTQCQKKKPVEQIAWMDGSVGGAEAEGGKNEPAAPAPEVATTPAREPEPEPEPVPEPVAPPEPEPKKMAVIPPPPPIETPPVEPPPPSEIVTPAATPPPTPKPITPKPVTPKPLAPKPITPKPEAPKPPTPKPKPVTPKVVTPKPATPKAKAPMTPKTKVTPSATATPKSKPATATPKAKAGTANPEAEADAKKPDGAAAAATSGKTGTAKAGGATASNSGKAGSGKPGGNGPGDGKGKSDFGWYNAMLGDVFKNRWSQPTSVVRSGTDFVTTLKIRISKDGVVSHREIVRSSGNPVMDESVLAAAAKVTSVDPLPAGITGGDFYEITINFKLDQGN